MPAGCQTQRWSHLKLKSSHHAYLLPCPCVLLSATARQHLSGCKTTDPKMQTSLASSSVNAAQHYLAKAGRNRSIVCQSASHSPMQPTQQSAHLFGLVGRLWYASTSKQQQLPAPQNPQGLRAQMASLGSSCMAALPLASATVRGGNGWSVADLCEALSKAVEIYLFLLTVRVLLTWFQNINWYSEPFRTIRSFTDPALNACRGILPSIGGIDLSPMLLFFGLQFAARQLKMIAIGAA